jgi:membrane protein YdbS with pleckstrin-like domain
MGESEAQTIILNLDQKPFASFDRAAKMRDLLINESVHHYRVELFETGNESAGFMVTRGGKVQGAHAINHHSNHEEVDPRIQVLHKVYHPALRTYLLHIPVIIIGLLLVLFAVEVWMFALFLLGIKGLPGWIDGGVLVNITQIAGSMFIVWLLSGILINYYGTSLVIDIRGISFKRGILTRDVTNVRFAEIRTIGLRQGILDRLLNIGILEFASSGTDDVDIRFINIANPAGVKAEIEAIIEQRIQR